MPTRRPMSRHTIRRTVFGMSAECRPAERRLRRPWGNGPLGPFPARLRWVPRLAPAWLSVLLTATTAGRLSTPQIVLVTGLLLVVTAGWLWVLVGRGGSISDQAALILAIGAASGLNVMTQGGQLYVVGYASIFVSLFFYGLPAATGTWASAVLAIGLGTTFIGRLDWIGGAGNAAGAFFFGMAALSWGRVMRESQRNAQLVQELQQSREAEQANAVAAERARLARELHDVLAHTLSSLALHLESTRALASSRSVEPDVLARLERGVALARTGLEEARNAVGTLRDGALPGPDRIRELVEEFRHSSGIDAHYVEEGTPVPLSTEAKVALFRTAQEALTNVAKHSHARRVEVGLRWQVGGVQLRISDDGSSADTVTAALSSATLAGGGNGLRGMRERAELAGGRLDAGRTAGGFRVEVELPA